MYWRAPGRRPPLAPFTRQARRIGAGFSRSKWDAVGLSASGDDPESCPRDLRVERVLGAVAAPKTHPMRKRRKTASHREVLRAACARGTNASPTTSYDARAA